MARNRKRNKDGRAGRTTGSTGLPSASNGHDAGDGDATPAALEHSAPDVELADAQLALGRPELADLTPAYEEEFEHEADDAARAYSDGDAALPAARGHTDVMREGTGNRLVHFLQGSWRELQRVQWPDRRQVMQATGVVLGFVILAGVFLGASDFVATKLVNFVLK